MAVSTTRGHGDPHAKSSRNGAAAAAALQAEADRPERVHGSVASGQCAQSPIGSSCLRTVDLTNGLPPSLFATLIRDQPVHSFATSPSTSLLASRAAGSAKRDRPTAGSGRSAETRSQLPPGDPRLVHPRMVLRAMRLRETSLPLAQESPADSTAPGRARRQPAASSQVRGGEVQPGIAAEVKASPSAGRNPARASWMAALSST